MGSAIVQSCVIFVRNMIPAVILFAAAVSDPLHWANALGLSDGNPDWIYPAIWRQSICFGLCLLWLLVWFHRNRIAFGLRQPQEPNMPLYLACRWIARDSVWAEKYDPSIDDDWVRLVDEELMAKVLQGRIDLFGKRHRLGNPTEPMQHVAPAFKGDAQWNSHNLVSREPPTHMWQQGGDSYYNVSLDGSRVRSLWPKRSLLARLRHRSPIERIGGKDYGGVFPAQDSYYREKEPVLMSAFEELFGKHQNG